MLSAGISRARYQGAAIGMSSRVDAYQRRQRWPGIGRVPCGQTPSRAAAVTESSVTKSVTSTPRATSPSVSRLAIDSYGP